MSNLPGQHERTKRKRAASSFMICVYNKKPHFCVANTQEARTPSKLSNFAACTPSMLCQRVTLVYSCVVDVDRCTGQVPKMLAAPSPGESGAMLRRSRDGRKPPQKTTLKMTAPTRGLSTVMRVYHHPGRAGLDDRHG